MEQAGFAVEGPDILSILVETGFISNPEEESKLNDDDYQHQLADALLLGIQRYFTKTLLWPATGGVIAAPKKNGPDGPFCDENALGQVNQPATFWLDRAAFQPLNSAIKPGTKIMAQMILLRLACTKGMLPNQ